MIVSRFSTPLVPEMSSGMVRDMPVEKENMSALIVKIGVDVPDGGDSSTLTIVVQPHELGWVREEAVSWAEAVVSGSADMAI